MKFGILGYGYVGKATHLGLLNNQKCIVHDTIFESERSVLKDAGTIFVCIPTETQQDINTVISEWFNRRINTLICECLNRFIFEFCFRLVPAK